MMARYANSTSVSSDKSRNEIERILAKNGADQFYYGWDGTRAVIGFRMRGRNVKFVLPMPDRNSREFTHTPEKGRIRSVDAQQAAFEQAGRQRWRALLLVIKAKFEAIDVGIVEFEDEFLAHIVLPDGQTAGNWIKPQIAVAYEHGDMPTLLPAPGGE